MSQLQLHLLNLHYSLKHWGASARFGQSSRFTMPIRARVLFTVPRQEEKRAWKHNTRNEVRTSTYDTTRDFANINIKKARHRKKAKIRTYEVRKNCLNILTQVPNIREYYVRRGVQLQSDSLWTSFKYAHHRRSWLSDTKQYNLYLHLKMQLKCKSHISEQWLLRATRQYPMHLFRRELRNFTNARHRKINGVSSYRKIQLQSISLTHWAALLHKIR